MNRNKKQKPYWEMNLEELREATKEFDEEFVADKARPLTPKERARWERIQTKLIAEEGQKGQEFIAVRLEKKLLDRCTALAKKKRISRDDLIARGLKAVLAAEGEE
jgi:hypothetical protein